MAYHTGTDVFRVRAILERPHFPQRRLFTNLFRKVANVAYGRKITGAPSATRISLSCASRPFVRPCELRQSPTLRIVAAPRPAHKTGREQDRGQYTRDQREQPAGEPERLTAMQRVEPV